jgi:Asp-tRNA(Asn)/Glu-tRNA(Gln) amidotransferase A subunit family amidase
MLQMAEKHLPDMSRPLVSHSRRSRLGLYGIPPGLKNLASRACGIGLESERCSVTPICKVSPSIILDSPDFNLTGFDTEWNNVAPEMDVILCPAFPTPAPLHDTSRYWGYTSLFNLLDYPALVFPVTKVDPERDAKDTTYIPKNEFDSWAYEHYDPVKQKHAPVSLQLVAKRLEEEKLLQAFREIKEKLGLPFVDCLA